jgi:hypothetical protein
MKADISAYRILGLQPGAGPVAIEAAYRRLITRHHPDRRGGNSERAAEINSAYQQLKREFGDELGRRRGPPVPVQPSYAPKKPRAGRWVFALAAVAVIVGVSEREAIVQRIDGVELPVVSLPGAAGQAAPRAQPADLSQIPLDAVAIDRSVLDAVRIAADGSEEALSDQSRACYRQLQLNPEPSRLDRCIAFDETVAALLERDPFDGRGMFSASAMTARHLGAGRLVSNDMLAVESRLARIRTRVALNLAPPDPQPRAVRPPA